METVRVRKSRAVQGPARAASIFCACQKSSYFQGTSAGIESRDSPVLLCSAQLTSVTVFPSGQVEQEKDIANPFSEAAGLTEGWAL